LLVFYLVDNYLPILKGIHLPRKKHAESLLVGPCCTLRACFSKRLRGRDAANRQYCRFPAVGAGQALIISVRNQSWVIKLDYNDGKETGNILWRLGYQGDFALQNGTDPQDWFYAQHDAHIISLNTSGVAQPLLFDDGNARVLNSGGPLRPAKLAFLSFSSTKPRKQRRSSG
jgi:Arylsulfotransferase (ASST)